MTLAPPPDLPESHLANLDGRPPCGADSTHAFLWGDFGAQQKKCSTCKHRYESGPLPAPESLS